MPNLKPTLGRVLIKRGEPEQVSGGIIIPENAQEKATKGQVSAIGEFEKDKVIDIKVGDVVYFTKWAGTEIKDKDGNAFIVLKTDEIIAIEG